MHKVVLFNSDIRGTVFVALLNIVLFFTFKTSCNVFYIYVAN